MAKKRRAKPKAKPKTKVKAKPKVKTKAKPKAKTKAKPKAKPKVNPKAKTKAKPKAKPKVISKVKRIAKTVKKPKVAIFDLTGCDGDQTSILSLEDDLLDIIGAVDLCNFRLGRAQKDKGPFDIAFVEGGIARKDEVEQILKIRKSAKILVAMGACACYGGPQSAKNKMVAATVEKSVYHKTKHLNLIEPSGIDKYVDVDYYLRGCPINKFEFVAFVKQVLAGKLPHPNNNPVCVECKFNENMCMFDKKTECMGPITYGGCDAICLNNNEPCVGCRGFIDDLNLKAHVDLLIELGFDDEQIRHLFAIYTTTSRNIGDLEKVLSEARK